MDPNAALDQMRTLVARLKAMVDADKIGDHETGCYVSELVDTWEGLDDWLQRGGFLPRAWRLEG